MNGIDKLIKINDEFQAGVITLKSNPNFKGQSWGGAGVMILSTDEETRNQFSHRQDKDEILYSVYATEISDLFEIIKSQTYVDINHLSKLYLWGRVTRRGVLATSENSNISLNDLVRLIIEEAIECFKQINNSN